MNLRDDKGLTAILAALVLAASGCASTPTAENGNQDPLEGANRPIYTFNDKVDHYFIKPVAETYADYTPEPVRAGITNFFDNIFYLNVILNDFLQGKLGQGLSDFGRFAVNSTVGFGGLFDPATPWGLPKHDEDLGQTLGVWGLDEVAYLVLPFLGPSSVRDAPDLASSTLLNPLFYISSPVIGPLGVLGIINERANFLDETRLRDEAALDAYVFTREGYRQKRTSVIHDGEPPVDEFDDFLEEEYSEQGVLEIK